MFHNICANCHKCHCCHFTSFFQKNKIWFLKSDIPFQTWKYRCLAALHRVGRGTWYSLGRYKIMLFSWWLHLSSLQLTEERSALRWRLCRHSLPPALPTGAAVTRAAAGGTPAEADTIASLWCFCPENNSKGYLYNVFFFRETTLQITFAFPYIIGWTWLERITTKF